MDARPEEPAQSSYIRHQPAPQAGNACDPPRDDQARNNDRPKYNDRPKGMVVIIDQGRNSVSSPLAPLQIVTDPGDTLDSATLSPFRESSLNQMTAYPSNQSKGFKTELGVRGSTPQRPQVTSIFPQSPVTGSVTRPTSLLTIPNRSFGSPTTGVSVYPYDELGQSEFRLVKVLPTRMSKLKCELTTWPIGDPCSQEYVAISYAWGDAGDTEDLQVDGFLVSVSISLCDALRALRKRTESVTVWVDALCINQSNREERAQQVKLMTKIYSQADSVAVWLGPDANKSSAALTFLQDVSERSDSRMKVTEFLSSQGKDACIPATVSLFERDYWKRLWVVQEVYNAQRVNVYCGSSSLSWGVYHKASKAFQGHETNLDRAFPSNSQGRLLAAVSENHFTNSSVLAYQGPGSFPDLTKDYGTESLLQIMRVCRRKLASDPKDKVFGILGLLREDTRDEFEVDYNLSLRDIYTNVVDLSVNSTGCLDIICESIHYPPYMSTAKLPSWVPDWSHIPDIMAIGAMSASPPFSASRNTEANFVSVDGRRKLDITGIQMDTIKARGIAVGTLCTLADHLMAFLHWRAIFLSEYKGQGVDRDHQFCRALCLNQVPSKWAGSDGWVTVCYHLFASLLKERLPQLPLDEGLLAYLDAKVDIRLEDRRAFLLEHFGSRMMGRCFYITHQHRLGLGSGAMAVDDKVIVAFGCSTPIILRPDSDHSTYRYVGDAYLNGYMYGRAIERLDKRESSKRNFVLC